MKITNVTLKKLTNEEAQNLDLISIGCMFVRGSAKQRVKGYKITRVNSAKKGTLSAIVRIIPTEGVEFFNLTIELGDDLTITLQ